MKASDDHRDCGSAVTAMFVIAVSMTNFTNTRQNQMRPLMAILCGFGMLMTTAQAVPMVYNLRLTGDQEVPGPGDSDGLATGPISLDSTTGQIEWDFSYTNIASPTAMHIHTGAAGASGGVLIGLGTAGTPGNLVGSLVADPTIVASIVAAPENFYVNIHNADFPPGAVRGQVAGVPEPSAAIALSAGAIASITRRKRQTRERRRDRNRIGKR